MSLTIENAQKARANALSRLSEVEASTAEEKNKLKAVINKLDDWLWENGTHDATTAIAEFVELRDKRASLKEAYDAEDRRIKEQMAKREAWLLKKCTDDKMESIRTEYGTAYTQDKTRYNVSDWTGYWGWLIENGRLDLLEKRPAQGPLSKMAENGEELPPGLNVFTEKTITVRRA